MAEICVDCWKKLYGTEDAKKMLVMSDELDLCEECGEYKPTIVRIKTRYLLMDLVHQWMEYYKLKKRRR